MYSRQIKDHLMSPYNGRVSGPYNGVGTYTGVAHCPVDPSKVSKNTVEFKVAVGNNGIIVDARWQVFGDPVAIATCSWCVMQMVGKTIDEMANLLIPERAAVLLDIREEVDVRGGCLTAIMAVANAFNDYKKQGSNSSLPRNSS
jgi:NifU-like protein involved in Fe-S cluster formation